MEICKYFQVPLCYYNFKEIYNTNIDKKTISIFPISTSVIRNLPYDIIEQIVKYFSNSFRIKIIIDDSQFSKQLEEKNKQNNFWLVKPKDIQSLILEISKTYLGIFMDSGPLHLAKILNIQGVLIETSVNSDILLANYKRIKSIKNLYKSEYCQGPCGLVDIFEFNKKVGCYETNQISFDHIKFLKSFKNLQRWSKQENNKYFYSNPVSCVKKLNVKSILNLIKIRLKEIK